MKLVAIKAPFSYHSMYVRVIGERGWGERSTPVYRRIALRFLKISRARRRATDGAPYDPQNLKLSKICSVSA
jgi:hypothetical protein